MVRLARICAIIAPPFVAQLHANGRAMKQRRFISFAWIFLLLFAQQSAITHAVWHASDHGPAQHKNKGDASYQGKLCGLHGAFSQVVGGVQPSAAQEPLPQCAAQTIEYRPGPLVVPELHVPLSRGPPLLS